MFRPPLFASAIVALCLSPLYAADPGPQLPLFRRAPVAAPATPKKAAPPEKLDVPKPFAPPKEALGLSEEKTDGDQVDVAEVLRRGDHVTRAGRGPMGASDRTIGDAVSPPADDSHKWFLSIVVESGAKESEALLYDLKHSPDLRAWANAEEAKDSWSHVTVYVKGDESQDWRWKNLRITRYPAMILQPPATLMDDKKPDSWEWGDPSTVVWQWDGYDATQPERAKLRADAIRKVLLAYVGKVSATRDRLATTDKPSPGPKQAAGKPSDNTGAPVFPQLPSTPGNNPVLADPTVPSTTGQQPTGSQGGLSLLLQALGLLTTGTGATNTLLAGLVALRLFELIAKRTPNKVDDQIVAFFRGVADQLPSQTGPTK